MNERSGDGLYSKKGSSRALEPMLPKQIPAFRRGVVNEEKEGGSQRAQKDEEGVKKE